jgi:hypothetical protein
MGIGKLRVSEEMSRKQQYPLCEEEEYGLPMFRNECQCKGEGKKF